MILFISFSFSVIYNHNAIDHSYPLLQNRSTPMASSSVPKRPPPPPPPFARLMRSRDPRNEYNILPFDGSPIMKLPEVLLFIYLFSDALVFWLLLIIYAENLWPFLVLIQIEIAVEAVTKMKSLSLQKIDGVDEIDIFNWLSSLFGFQVLSAFFGHRRWFRFHLSSYAANAENRWLIILMIMSIFMNILILYLFGKPHSFSFEDLSSRT